MDSVWSCREARIWPACWPAPAASVGADAFFPPADLFFAPPPLRDLVDDDVVVAVVAVVCERRGSPTMRIMP